MNPLIIEKLNKLEEQKQIKIFYACESGSRAWGFPSLDSDYDIRFIYTHPTDWYLTLKEKEDTIEIPINNELDIGGWELKKALKLMWKSNAPLLEWIQSPIVYKKEDTFLKEMQQLGEQCFSAIAVMYHYLNMAKKYVEICSSGEQVKLKHYFYALRATIAGEWIKQKQTMPPVEFTNMLTLIDKSLENRINDLVELKSRTDESYLHFREPLIDAFLIDTIQENERIAKELNLANIDLNQLDNFFRKWIK
ncbi:putative nucleotidyltransferase [Cylindrospermum stagnale PCC 7417]|uniref:Putative nucleotidyltransferase n=1 Tax=Cylindrospermum stagnale PCC 7417 TaxID=56107 RepID=K9WXE9_9NOST|nr:nucleotidyltransferase domain-containing protein [Cylindrospermum stagnale]AFZ24476.1 putative nucleotidyltransferase [Cylindrospermum stagnale PCC 7417]